MMSEHIEEIMYNATMKSSEVIEEPRIQQLEQDKAEIEAKYQELVMAVERKFMGESRHETALRYIKEAEAYKSESTGVARMEEK